MSGGGARGSAGKGVFVPVCLESEVRPADWPPCPDREELSQNVNLCYFLASV